MDGPLPARARERAFYPIKELDFFAVFPAGSALFAKIASPRKICKRVFATNACHGKDSDLTLPWARCYSIRKHPARCRRKKGGVFL